MAEKEFKGEEEEAEENKLIKADLNLIDCVIISDHLRLLKFSLKSMNLYFKNNQNECQMGIDNLQLLGFNLIINNNNNNII